MIIKKLKLEKNIFTAVKSQCIAYRRVNVIRTQQFYGRSYPFFIKKNVFFSGKRFQEITFKVAQHQNQTARMCATFGGPISDPLDKTQNPVRIKCRIPQVGRFVHVTASDESLEMCELEVYTKRNAN